MNILEALNIALPELPAEAVRVERPPRVDPSIIVREQLQEGRPVVLLLIPEIHNYYVFEPPTVGTAAAVRWPAQLRGDRRPLCAADRQPVYPGRH